MLSSLKMPQTVTLPVFGSAGNQAHPSGDGAQGTSSTSEWPVEPSGDPSDFDLLAEYLLEDNQAVNTSGLNFDFNGESTNVSTVVSPEQSIDGGPADSGVVQAQQIITQHASGIQQLLDHKNAVVVAPVTTHPPIAPAPPPSHPPMVAAQGIAVPAPSNTYAAHATHIAPAPAGIAASGVSTGITHQTSTAITKRRRVNASGSGSGGAPVLADPMAVAAALQGRGRKKTQAQIDRRRERNRILARRTRLRKKFFFESLQKEVIDLQRENAALKDIVRTQLAEDGKSLLNECNATERLPQAVVEACGESATDYDQQDFNLVRSIQHSQHSFVITDPSLQDNPIVFASDDFLNLTGYSREDVLGRNCRFLQGTDTNQSKIEQIRKGLETGEDITVTLVNYTSDGNPFWNKLFIAALRDAQNNIVNFIGVIVKVGGPEPGDPEHGKKLPGESDAGDNDVMPDAGNSIGGASDAVASADNSAVVHG